MEKFFSFFLEIFLKSACRKLTAILEQNCKRNVDQHASEIMWLYGLRKKFFGRCLTYYLQEGRLTGLWLPRLEALIYKIYQLITK